MDKSSQIHNHTDRANFPCPLHFCMATLACGPPKESEAFRGILTRWLKLCNRVHHYCILCIYHCSTAWPSCDLPVHQWCFTDSYFPNGQGPLPNRQFDWRDRRVITAFLEYIAAYSSTSALTCTFHNHCIMGTPLDDGRDLFARIGLANLKESHVNGIWNHILSRFFPYPQFAILPEHWTDTRKPGGSRVDLVVWDINKNAPVFVYEGKGDVEDLRFKPDVLDDIISAGLTHNLNQIRRYLTTLPQRQGMSSNALITIELTKARPNFIRCPCTRDAVHYHELRWRSISSSRKGESPPGRKL